MEKALKGLFIVMLLALSLGDLGRIQFENGIAITIYDLSVGAFVSAWALFGRKKDSLVFLKPILLFAAIALISLLLNSHRLSLTEFFVSFLYLVRWIFYAAIAWAVLGFDSNFKQKVPFLTVFVAFIFVVIPGFFQYFFYPDLRNLRYLGWDEHLYRLFSTFLDPNFAACAFSLIFVLILTMLLKRKINSRFMFFFLLLSAFFTFIAILLTYSRSGYLMFFVSVIFLLFLLGKKRYSLILLTLFALGIFLIPKNLEGEGVKLLRTASFLNRLESAENAITIFKDSPVFGIGFNAFRYAQKRYDFIKGESWQVTHSGAGTDNSFLFVLATTGIIGFLSYLYLLASIIKRAYQNYRLKKSNDLSRLISVLVIVSYAGLIINSFFVNSLFFPFMMAWIWILVGLMESK